MPKVHFLNEVITVEVPAQTTLRDAAMQSGIELYRGMWTHVNCIGNGICGRCRVWILAPDHHLSPPSLRERFHRVRGMMRLACQVRVTGDIEVRTRPIGPPVIKEISPGLNVPPYKKAADQRYAEAKEAERREAEKKAAEAVATETSGDSTKTSAT